MQRAVRRGQPFDRQHVGALALQRQRGAGLHGNAVQMDEAGAALRGVAADMGACEPKMLAQELDQERAGVDIGGDGFAVHRHRNGWHWYYSSNPGRTACFPRRTYDPAHKSARNLAFFAHFVLWNKSNWN